MHEIYRQGDILLKRVKKPDLNGYIKSEKPIILGYGEATGHTHQIKEHVDLYHHENDDIEIFALSGKSSNQIFVNIKAGTKIEHQEHDKIDLDKGWYEVIRQREYTPERIRYVQD